MSPEARERSFDELARGLASGSISRGKALKLMGAALVGGALSSLGIGGVAAAAPRCKPTGRKCKNDTQCCSLNCDSSGFCLPSTGGPVNVDCTCVDRATGAASTFPLGCLSECPESETHSRVCNSVCRKNGLEFSSGGCTFQSPECVG
jgi:hypothetical protein